MSYFEIIDGVLLKILIINVGNGTGSFHGVNVKLLVLAFALIQLKVLSSRSSSWSIYVNWSFVFGRKLILTINIQINLHAQKLQLFLQFCQSISSILNELFPYKNRANSLFQKFQLFQAEYQTESSWSLKFY